MLKGCARFPGLHGTCEIEEIEIAIEPPCCCPPLAIGQVGDVREQPEDEEERGDPVGDAARQETAKLHAGDPENRRLWTMFMPACRNWPNVSGAGASTQSI